MSVNYSSLRNYLVYDKTASRLAYVPIGLNTAVGLTRLAVHVSSLVKNLFLILANSLSLEKNKGLDNKRHIYLLNIFVDLYGILRGMLEVLPLLGALGCLLYNKVLATPAQKLAYKIQDIYSLRIPKDTRVIKDATLEEYSLQAARELIELQGDFARFRPNRTLVDLRDLAIAGKLKGLDNGLKSEQTEDLINYQLGQLDQMCLQPYENNKDTWESLSKTNAIDLTTLQEEKLNSITNFLNGQSVFFSTDMTQIEAFLSLAVNWNYDHPIFSDKKVLHYAFTALAMGLMDAGDFATFSEIYITKQCFPDCKVHRLFDQQGELTEDGENFIKSLLSSHSNSMNKILLQRSDLIGFLKQLKPYQQAFWSHESLVTSADIRYWQQRSPFSAFEMLYAPIGSLASTLGYLGAVYNIENRQIGMGVHLHHRAINQLYGTECVPYVPKLGQFNPKHIIEGVEKGHRLGATYFQASFPTTVHDSLELPSTIIEHDKAHAQILHKHGPSLMKVILRTLKVIKEATGFEMSKEIWMIGEAVACLFEENYDFLKFMSDVEGKIDEAQICDMFWDFSKASELPSPTPILWLILLDVDKHPDVYAEQKEFLSSDLVKIIKDLKTMQLISDSDDIKTKIWVLQQCWGKSEFKSIRESKNHLKLSQLKFAKITKADTKDKRLLNKIVLRYSPSIT